MDYGWDEEKNDGNKREHGIAFEQAVKAFDDPLAVPLEDVEHSDEWETRYGLIGMCEVGLIFVSFTYRNENTRLISARRASKKMVRIYEGEE